VVAASHPENHAFLVAAGTGARSRQDHLYGDADPRCGSSPHLIVIGPHALIIAPDTLASYSAPASLPPMGWSARLRDTLMVLTLLLESPVNRSPIGCLHSVT
jgi:hypothetical protein